MAGRLACFDRLQLQQNGLNIVDLIFYCVVLSLTQTRSFETGIHGQYITTLFPECNPFRLNRKILLFKTNKIKKRNNIFIYFLDSIFRLNSWIFRIFELNELDKSLGIHMIGMFYRICSKFLQIENFSKCV